MDDFVRCAALLASPATDPALRAQADAWLAAFRLEPAAWAAALGVLRSAGVPPEVRLQAASLLAWKVKRQLGQLQPVERQAELAEALAGLAEAAPAPPPGQARDPAVRCVCVALANLAIQCSGWVRPLDTLGERGCRGAGVMQGRASVRASLPACLLVHMHALEASLPALLRGWLQARG